MDAKKVRRKAKSGIKKSRLMTGNAGPHLSGRSQLSELQLIFD